MPYEVRFYREWVNTPDLVSFQVKVKETDLQVRARKDLTQETLALVRRVRRDIETYISAVPEFLTSLAPLPQDPQAPEVVQAMLRAGELYGVGPMAAVAGAVAEAVGRRLLELSPDLIIENGGDIFLMMSRPVRLCLYAGDESPFTNRIVLALDARRQARGVCTSSAKVGPSLSFGNTDAVVTIAKSAAVADAAATAIGNRIRRPEDLETVLATEQDRGELLGCVAVIGKHLGAWGEVEITR